MIVNKKREYAELWTLRFRKKALKKKKSETIDKKLRTELKKKNCDT